MTIGAAIGRGLLVWTAIGSIGCSSAPDAGLYGGVDAPNFTTFVGGGNDPGVHTFLERRCGTLDCHGQIGRPLRIYGTGGLRLVNDAGLIPGSGPTTPQEVYASYLALVGLQPEETSRVVSGAQAPRSLLIVAKPLALQTHKGGQVLASGDPGDICLESWLQGRYDATGCSDAAQVP